MIDKKLNQVRENLIYGKKIKRSQNVLMKCTFSICKKPLHNLSLFLHKAHKGSMVVRFMSSSYSLCSSLFPFQSSEFGSSTISNRLAQVNSVNLQFNTVGRWDDDMIVPPSDGPMFILIDWE